jgi:transcriptional regulator with XRE-family HTH domain
VNPQDVAVTLGPAIRRARGRTTQQQLAELLETDQGRISKWERGHHRPTLEEIRSVERALGRPDGFILFEAGYLTLPTTIEETVVLTIGYLAYPFKRALDLR